MKCLDEHIMIVKNRMNSGAQIMKFFYTIKGYRMKHYFIVLVAALFSATLIYVEKEQIAVFTTAIGPKAVDSIETDEKKIALTFDISWGDERAIPILDVLKKLSINNATFFLSGAWAERHPEVVERIVEDGHEIGSLGFRYEHYTKLEADEISRDIRLSEQVLYALTDQVPTLIRPPHGSFDDRVLSIAEQQNYTVVHWSVDSHDWKNPGIEQIVTNVVTPLTGGEIVLLHASDSAKQTAEALPFIIERLKKEGYQFVTVTELLANMEIETEEIK